LLQIIGDRRETKANEKAKGFKVLLDKAEESDIYFVHLNVWESRKGKEGEDELYRPTTI